MGRVTEISWTATRLPDGTMLPGATFNPWYGCAKVSDGCKFCYAEELMDKRYGRVKWGKERVRTSAANWKQPLKWNREAEQSGIRRKVFCASLADVFDDQASGQWRGDLWELILETPHLDWLILTKRPEVMLRIYEYEPWEPPANLWLGVSVEHQKAADERIPLLLQVPAVVRFLSVEPLLSAVDLNIQTCAPSSCEGDDDGSNGYCPGHFPSGLHWVIIGGESGAHRREMKLEWAERIVRQCQVEDVPVFIKQDSAFKSGQQGRIPDELWALKQFPQPHAQAGTGRVQRFIAEMRERSPRGLIEVPK